MLNCGDTFLIEDEEGDERHLRIVLTTPVEGEVVLVCVVTRRERSETLVTLRKGDHPFIKHDSVIAYAYSKIVALIEDFSVTQESPLVALGCIA